MVTSSVTEKQSCTSNIETSRRIERDQAGVRGRRRRQGGLSKRDAGAAVDAALDVIQGTLQNGDHHLHGFGKFHVTRRAARQGVNPRTGERVQIAAANVPKFSAGSQLKKAVN